MSALSIGFDTIIVGALALPWVLLILHLFFSENESSVQALVDWVNKLSQPAVAGVLLFAVTYSLGSAVSRIAQDFFDDDDLHVGFGGYSIQVGVTETSIRTDVYCQALRRGVVTEKPSEPFADERKSFGVNDSKCEYTGRWIVARSHDWVTGQQSLATNLFRLQEAAVLLKGTDATERMRQFHDQIMVLRGATFDGFIAFSLLLFWWSSGLHSRLRWAVPLLYLLPGAVALWHHLRDRGGDPPYMEFTLLTLAAAGWYVLWQRKPKDENATDSNPAHAMIEVRIPYLVLAIFLTVAGFLGWWATQVLYDQQVIYSYRALSESPSK
ncbi:MAG TPA: hypothetical protein VN911_05415 [Candidatus Acidoferrum sp.]|nr:hypothetical protein [Candidatus Acidoferrum sp.]